MHRLSDITLGIVLGVFIGITTSSVVAWNAPTATPPNGNVSGAPITTGAGQIKSGGLILNSAGTSIAGLIVANGNVGVGTNSPRAKLDVRGDIVSSGNNAWMLHTPDDGRTSMWFGSSVNDSTWSWPYEFQSDGVLKTTAFKFAPRTSPPQPCSGATEGLFYYDNNTNQPLVCDGVNWKNFQGPAGPAGANGATGAKGDKGDKGAKGDKGDKGAKGDKGDKGNKGDTGAKGDKGDKGDRGDQGPAGPSSGAIVAGCFRLVTEDWISAANDEGVCWGGAGVGSNNITKAICPSGTTVNGSGSRVMNLTHRANYPIHQYFCIKN